LKFENTPKVRSFLREISKDLPYFDVSSKMKEILPSTAQGFLLLYVNIDQAEELLARSERNSKIVAKVKKLLPSGTSINVIKRRIAIAQKIYDIFSTIGEDKIQRIRNFSAS
ncbi:1738_t:CDS:2, partial [Racocetra persica]